MFSSFSNSFLAHTLTILLAVHKKSQIFRDCETLDPRKCNVSQTLQDFTISVKLSQPLYPMTYFLHCFRMLYATCISHICSRLNFHELTLSFMDFCKVLFTLLLKPFLLHFPRLWSWFCISRNPLPLSSLFHIFNHP